MEQLQEPAEYMPLLEKLREKNEYAKKWRLRIQKHTNRHSTTYGNDWGWYEVHPLGITVGYWESGVKDALKGVDLDKWNEQAKALSIDQAIAE